MKRILIVLMVMGLPFTMLHAAGGKNLLDPDNFLMASNTLSSIDLINVSASTTYTLSMPEYSMLDDVEVLITGETGTVYVDETLGTYDVCYTILRGIACTFETAANETALNISFSNGFIGQWYAYYEMYDFQLEEGSEKTSFEEYIPGETEDDITPLVQGAGFIEVNYAKDESLASVIDKYITVIDNMDGDVTDSIVVIADAYTGNETIIGSYVVLLSASDSAGNTTQFELTIVVVDEVPPVISGPSTVTIQIDDKPLIDDLVTDHFTFNDAYSGSISTYEIIEDTYSDATELGDYNVTLSIQDVAGNHTTRQFMISLVSESPPHLEGPDSITLYLSENPGDSHILALFTGTDRADQSSIPVIIKESTLLDYTQAGRYTVTLETTDQFDNVSSKTITVNLHDDIPPIFTYDDQIIIPLGTEMDDLDIFRMVKNYYQSQGITIDYYTLLRNDYDASKHLEGDYPFEVEIVSSTGEVFTHQGMIRVEDVTYQEPFNDHLILISGFVFLVLAGLWLKRK